MNSDKRKTASGNALIYILLALALLAGLTMVLARQNSGASGEDLSNEQTELLATRMVSYAGSAKNIVDQMMFSGTPVGSLNYLRPIDTGYDAPPNTNKVFHPDGGGLTLDAVDPVIFTDGGTTPPPGWYMGRFNNFEWTKTGANDVVLVAFGISQQLCLNIDKKILGRSAVVPAITTTGNMAQYFVSSSIPDAVANANFDKVICPDCDGMPSMCVSNKTGDQWAYYNIISGQ